jgi:outer membrane protein TolC
VRRLASLAAVCLVLGCAAAPERGPARTRLPLPAESPPIGTGGAAVTSAAVAPIGSASVAIDLPTALRLAGAKPNAIRIAEERVAEADAVTDAALAGLLPQVVVGGDFRRHNGTIQDVQGAFLTTTKQSFFAGGTGELVLDMGGSVFSFLRDRQRREAATEDLESVTQERIQKTAEEYFALTGAQAEVAIAEDALAHARAFEEVAASRERNRIGLRVDTLRAQAQVAGARQDLIVAEERARIASIRLATILKLDATVTLRTAETEVRPITFVSPETTPERLIATALENHPDIRAADRRVRAADLEDDAAHYGPFIPTFRAGVGGSDGGLGYDGPHLSELKDREDYYAGIELRFTGLGFGEIARARATSARLRAEKVRAEDVRERVVGDVLEAREVVRARNAAIEVALDELRAADEARKIAQKRLEQGTGLGIDVLAADESRTRAATHVVEAIVGYNSAQYQLLARVGERPGE